MKKILSFLFVFLALTSVAHAETFVFTAIPDEDESRLRSRFDKVATYLSQELGVEVKYIPVKSYGAAVTAFLNNQVQLAWFGGLSGVRARLRVPGSEAIAQGFEDQAFVTYFIANSSTGLKEGKDFPGKIQDKTFTFGSKGSTSGRLMPEFYIREHFKKSPEDVFKRVGFSGDHSKTIQLVQSGAYQVGALNFKVWENEIKAGKVDPSKVSIIWKTPPYPDYQWSIRGDVNTIFGAGFKDKVTRSLLEMKDPDLLASFPRRSFIPARNSDYQPIVDVGKKVGLLD
ncbi:MAG: putative selenate ABC transporter substrate-binding protein [Rhodospirillaceae bacterium]|nr:putative selenate ABC transporter substrate-binding protein [Rhodospirillaceae bacterium]MCK5545815.1 putative selenate ABC transporter substrate-binding protein [Rhodospirillaceae bacterium]